MIGYPFLFNGVLNSLAPQKGGLLGYNYPNDLPSPYESWYTAMEQDLKVVIVEDEALYREMLAASLRQRQGLLVVGDWATGEEALQHLPALKPDVAIVDISLGEGMTGIQLGLQLRRFLPTLGIVLLSNTLMPSMLRRIPDQALGGWSYLHKQHVSNLGVLEHAIRSTAAGLVALDPDIRMKERTDGEGGGPLTARQLDVLRLMAQGYSNEGIATSLELSAKSVANYTNAIYERLHIPTELTGVQPRVSAVLYFLKRLVEDQ